MREIAIEHSSEISHCAECGWWCVRNSWSNVRTGADGNWPRSFGSEYWPILKRFQADSAEIPIETLRRHLRQRYSDVSQISAQKAEELVLAVFKEHYKGAEVRYFRGSTFAADDGIDLVIVDVNEGQIGVQVKRRINRSSEPVHEVKSFVASLFLNGMRKGVYVALSSQFSKQSQAVGSNPYLIAMGLELDLVDGQRFYEMLSSQALAAPKPVWLELIETKENCSNPEYFASLVSLHNLAQGSGHS
jgi:restriction endonuclease